MGKRCGAHAYGRVCSTAGIARCDWTSTVCALRFRGSGRGSAKSDPYSSRKVAQAILASLILLGPQEGATTTPPKHRHERSSHFSRDCQLSCRSLSLWAPLGEG